MNINCRSVLHGFFCILLTYVISFQAHSYQPRNLISVRLEDAILHVELNDANLRIRAVNKGTVEVFYQPPKTKQLPSFALPKNSKTYTQVELIETKSAYQFSLPDLTVNIQKQPFKLTYTNQRGLLSSEEVGMFNFDGLRGFRFKLADNEQIMGGGERILGMDRRNQRMPLYNKAHYGYTDESNQMYFGLSAVMSTKGYIIAFDNSASGHLDIGYSEKDVLQFEAKAGRTSYLFSAGSDARGLIENFVSATGKQPLPPRWALGNYASRFGYKTQNEVIETIELFEKQDFPVDAVVIDLYWFGPEIKGHMGNLNWDTKNWPEPEKMIETLANKGVNTIVITEPFILSTSSEWQSAVDNKALSNNLAGSPKRFDFYFGNTGLVDVFDEKAQDWFWQYYNTLNQQGVAGWWGDLGEPEVHPGDTVHKVDGELASGDEIHNAYGHKWAEMLYERQRIARPNERPFIMMRSGFLGSQRYGMVPWTGDVDRSWRGLSSQVELSLQMGLFGLAYTHSDLGGFAGGEVFDPELYIRWLQYGVFQPVYRPHAQDHIPPEPVFHDQNTKNIVRDYIKLRYRLLPYNYSLSMQNSLSGLPMMRPLFLDYPDQDISRTDAYLWGDAFLVAPIIKQGETAKNILLPEGIWFNFWDHKIYSGGQIQQIDAPLENLPVLVKAGSFIPMTKDIRNTKEYTSNNLQVHFYAHKDAESSAYTLFDDDGVSPNSIADNAYQTINFSSAITKDRVSGKSVINVQVDVQGMYPLAVQSRTIDFMMHNIEHMPQKVSVNGITIAVVKQKSRASQNHAYYDSSTNTLHVSGTFDSSLKISVN